MKQSKTADFENVSFKAKLDSGVIALLEIQDSHGAVFTLSAQETNELYDWLANDVLAKPRIAMAPVASGTSTLASAVIASVVGTVLPAPESVLAPGYVPLESRGKIILPAVSGDTAAVVAAAKAALALPHGTDAESVKNLLPWEKVVEGSGLPMAKAEGREVNIPVQVPHRVTTGA